MGECLISRRGGMSFSKMPILNMDYPQDTSVTASATGTVTLSIMISEHGIPAEYTYQWYVDGMAIEGATSSVCTLGDLTAIGSKQVYCEVTNDGGTAISRIATINILDPIPNYSYKNGATPQLIKEDNYNWYLKLTSSGTFTVDRDMAVDIFLLGAGGGAGYNCGGGGGGGKTATYTNIQLLANTDYLVEVGQANGGYSRFNQQYRADGGSSGGNGSDGTAGKGGNGGSGGGSGGPAAGKWSGGQGGSNGGNGSGERPGTGQGTTTYGFGESKYPLYAGGGGGGSWDGSAGKGGSGGGANGSNSGTGPSAAANTGGGGGGGKDWASGGSGGSGIVLIRNAR